MKRFIFAFVLVLCTAAFALSGQAFADSSFLDLATPLSLAWEQAQPSQVGLAQDATSSSVVQAFADLTGGASEPSPSDTKLASAKVGDAKPFSSAVNSLPRTGSNVPPLNDFRAAVGNAKPDELAGVYVPGTLALRIVQQPISDPYYVSDGNAETTQFRFASQFGTIGLMAHNNLGGALFFHLSVGQEVDVVYGDARVRRYSISRMRRFKVVRPDDLYSPMIDLDNGRQVSSTDAIMQVYAAGNAVVFQTCIEQNGDPAWGRLFVTALPN